MSRPEVVRLSTQLSRDFVAWASFKVGLKAEGSRGRSFSSAFALTQSVPGLHE